MIFPKTHECEAIVVTCIDFRFQKFIKDWLDSTLGDHAYDRVSVAGGIFDLFPILKQIEISHRLHHVKKIVLINHEDCGAYGDASTFDRHTADLLAARKQIHALVPDVDVDLFYLHVDGRFEVITGKAEPTPRHTK